MRDDLVHTGVLRPKFAEHLWSRAMKSAPSDRVLDALCRVVLDLGVALPLEPARLQADRRTANAAASGNGGRQDMLVIMRLPEKCGQRQQQEQREMIASLQKKFGYREITLKWRFDSAGPPYGLVERVIASCHAIGIVEMGLCWRYGAVFHSRLMARGGGSNRLYTFIIRYDNTMDDGRRILRVRMFGPLEDSRVWPALGWVASSMLNLSREWPGVLWEGWPECAQHPMKRTYFATPEQVLLMSCTIEGHGFRHTSCGFNM